MPDDVAVTERVAPSSTRRWWLLLAAGAFIATFALRSPGYVHRLYDPDEAAIAVQGMAMVRGGTLYTDVIDRKPPIPAWVYATSFRLTGTRDIRPVRVFVSLELALAALLIAWDLRRRAGPEAAVWGAALFVVGTVTLAPQDAQAANFSPMALLPGVAAIVAARRGTARSAVVAGVMVGLATLTRQSWAIGVVPAALSAWMYADRRVAADPADGRSAEGRRLRTLDGPPLARAAAVVLSALVTVAAVGLTVPLGLFLHWVFTGNGSLLIDLSQSKSVLLRALGSVVLFGVGHLVVCYLVVRHGRKAWRRELDLWLWLATALVSVVAGFRFFGHYWLQALPPLCLLGAPAIVGCGRRLRTALAGVVALTAAVFTVFAVAPRLVHRLPDATPLAAYVRSHTTPSQRVAVWGSYPEVYWLSDRLPAGGLVHTDFVVGKSAGRIEGPATLRDADPSVIHDYVASLEAEPPELFVDTSTADLRDYGKYPVSVLPQLSDLLRRRYRKVAVIDRVTVYQRSDPAPAGS